MFHAMLRRHRGFEAPGMGRIFAFVVFTIVVFGWMSFVGVVPPASGNAASEPFVPTMSVHFFDVNQGDATLFLGEEFAILIDAGRHDRSELHDRLRSTGVQFIDVFILTHPHADHIGQCPTVMENFGVGEVWMSGDAHTTRTFERCLDAIIASEAGYHEPRAGEAYRVGDARIEVIHPARVTGDLNNGSIGVRIVYGDVAFVMTGDGEVAAEAEMLARHHPLQADVLKLGHHGSRTSSTRAFVEEVAPVVAVYSAGAGNTYGHPHSETLATMAAAGVTLFGTDVNGTVVVETDGTSLNVVPERGSPVLEGAWAGGDDYRNGASAGGQGVKPGACPIHQVNLNTASEDELTRIIHVGPAIASRIVAARPFATIHDLLRVSGIGERRLEDIIAQGLACVGS